MVYKRFEELPVWQGSLKLALATYELASQPVFRRQRSLRDQLERAALSISNNIAEGFERGTNQECLPFCTSLAALREKRDPCSAC
jgi:four helix bundle protein